MQTYIVQPGDTLYGISKQFGVSVEDIKLENNLITNSITPGQALKIPTTATTVFYTVKRGDSLYSIAKTYDTTVAELISINNLKTNVLTVGQQLKIPINESPGNEVLYTVKLGDSLYSIAIKYNTTVQSLKDYNNLTTNNLSVGQVLKIPPTDNPVTTVVYIVKINDSLYSIAKKYNTTIDAIKKLNNLTSDTLSIGQSLLIPVSTPENPATDNYEIYVVKSGDSLYKIATKYNMTVEELMTLNNLSTTTLTIGQILKVKENNNSSQIPIGVECIGTGYVEPTYQTYTVKKGDSLYTIAKKFNTSIDNLKALNNLKDDNLSIGQILKIKENN